jgi:hypothetical protein
MGRIIRPMGIMRHPAIHGVREVSGGGLSLPYLVNFDGLTNGTTPEEFIAAHATDNVMPVVDDSDDYLGGWRPNPLRKIMNFDVDSTHRSYADYVLPDAVDITGGVRVSIWIGTAKDSPADTGFALLNDATLSGSEYDGIVIAPRRLSPYDMKMYSVVDASGTEYSSVRSMNKQYWQRHNIELFPATEQVYHVEKNWGSTIQWGPYTVTPANATNLFSEFTTLTHLRFYAQPDVNIYYGKLYLAGFWIGGPTDDWPADSTQGPPA